MGLTVYQCGSGPYGEFYYKRREGQQDQGLHLHLHMHYHSAVHLEVVENLSTTSFIMCLHHLAVSKEVPSIILSDNHRTFIAGETFLLEMQQDPAVQEHLSSNKQH